MIIMKIMLMNKCQYCQCNDDSPLHDDDHVLPDHDHNVHGDDALFLV